MNHRAWKTNMNLHEFQSRAAKARAAKLTRDNANELHRKGRKRLPAKTAAEHSARIAGT